MNKLFLFLIPVFLMIGCNKKVKPVPEDVFINILADMSLAESVLESSKYNKRHQYDSLIYYKYIFEKYGYTEKEFDTTLSYYGRDIEKMGEIYEKVTEVLQQRSSLLKDTVHIDTLNKNREDIWRLSNHWVLPRDGDQENISFNIPVKGPGKYTLSAKIKLYSDDESENPRIHVYFYRDDKNSNFGKRKYFKSVSLEKNNKFVYHTVVEELTDTSFKSIRGQILGHTNMGTLVWKKHAEVKNIRLYYEPLAKKE